MKYVYKINELLKTKEIFTMKYPISLGQVDDLDKEKIIGNYNGSSIYSGEQ